MQRSTLVTKKGKTAEKAMDNISHGLIGWRKEERGKMLTQDMEKECISYIHYVYHIIYAYDIHHICISYIERHIKNELRNRTERARQEWWDSQCKKRDIEELDGRGRSDLVYAKGKRLTKNQSCRSRRTAIKDYNRDLLTEPESVKNRRKEYIEVCYDKKT